MACNKDLQALDQPYPRTCADCGLGPCKKYPSFPLKRATSKDLAAIILALNYGELRAVAGEFSKMIDKEVRPKIETPDEFAEMLFDWAEAQQHQ